MHATASESGCTDSFPIAALKHVDGTKVDLALQKIADRLRQQGYRVAGAVRARITPPGADRCDLFLEELSTATVHPMSQNLGNGSHACRLDDVALDEIAERIKGSLRNGADIMILNKFGKQEAEGRGLRDPIVDAVDSGIPVLVGLSSSRVDSWNEFCGTACEIFSLGDAHVDRWLDAQLPH